MHTSPAPDPPLPQPNVTVQTGGATGDDLEGRRAVTQTLAHAITHRVPEDLYDPKMSDSALRILLGSAWTVTTITLSITAFLTINAVLAHVNENAPPHVADEANSTRMEVTHVALEVERPLTASQPPTPACDALGNAAAPRRVIRADPPPVIYVAEQKTKAPCPANSLAAEHVNTRVTDAIARWDIVQNDNQTIADEDLIEHEPSANAFVEEPQRCDSTVLGEICREVARWMFCHPDKWDKALECMVQKFDYRLD
jgi:hypothetical protein